MSVDAVQQHLPVIVVELVLVLGGVIAFAWWQFRDLARERRKRERRRSEKASRETPGGGSALS